MLNITYNPTLKKEKQLEYQEFRKLFLHEEKEHKGLIRLFINRLEEKGIITNGIYSHKQDNYLAKLICYMQHENIIKKDCNYISLARCFYGFFKKDVAEKAGENIVTISNVRKTLRDGFEGLSNEEKNDFALICSVFISRRE